MEYEPEVDDYVRWHHPDGTIDEGWVYFKGDPVDNEKRVKSGWNPVSQYITIETSVRPKTYSTENDPHRFVHTLLLCYEQDWNELEYVKHRELKEIQHYSQYDDSHGIES